jgi:hypothetical protein
MNIEVLLVGMIGVGVVVVTVVMGIIMVCSAAHAWKHRNDPEVLRQKEEKREQERMRDPEYRARREAIRAGIIARYGPQIFEKPKR